ncbi:MAG: large conductance mechanosensitive channel protein MscL [Patescibacteria group bacterium]|nr:large conductance mechanosensitive channel protein MscL [Patescibacteria group bacterium]MDE1940581.1 large conductance mechanosensitive channel protein MscL [Patescibacteria group bacterium]MDE1966996.1 large conductance mechanosensitive channel protein MscL [Patescibacteria group bacterium]
MKGFLGEFRSFILKGNAIELAIGVVIGTAFNAVVNSLVKDIILGAIANIGQQPDFSAYAWGAVKWGSFVNNVLNLVIVGFSVFVAIKVVNRLAGTRYGQPAPEEPAKK